MHTHMDHLRLREEEREGKEAGESEEGKERKGEGESKSSVDRLVCLAADDSFADDSASAASTTQFFVTIFALVRGLRSYVLCCWSRKAKEAWQQAELLLLEGLQKLTVLSRWAVVLLTQVEQRRREVSDLRIRHRSRGTAQETLRQSFALPAPLLMNRGRTLGNHLPLPFGISADTTDTWATYFNFGYWRHESRILMAKRGTHELTLWGHVGQFTQAFQQAVKGEWKRAELLLCEGLNKRTVLPRWALVVLIQVEQCRKEVSGLLHTHAADREGPAESVLPKLQSVGCHAGKT